MVREQQQLVGPIDVVKEATALDQQLREQWKRMKRLARVVGGLFKEIRNGELHKYVPKPGSKKHYHRFEEYVSDVTGGIANSTVWVMMRIHGLTEGPNPVPGHEVDEMPQQNAYELTKLEPEERTVEIVQRAKRRFRKRAASQPCQEDRHPRQSAGIADGGSGSRQDEKGRRSLIPTNS